MFGIAPWKNRQLLLYLFGSKNLLVFFDLSFRSRSQKDKKKKKKKEQNLLLKKNERKFPLGISLSLSLKNSCFPFETHLDLKHLPFWKSLHMGWDVCF